MASMEQRVQELADRDEIRELTARYCWHVTRGEGEATANLFTDDGVLDAADGGGPLLHGKPELLDFYRKNVREPRIAIPFIHNHIINLNGDEATGTCAIEARFTRGGDSVTAAGYYEDKYRRVDGKWRFVERKLFFHHVVPLSEGWAKAHAAAKSKSS